MRKRHFTLVEIMIVVAIIGLLAAIAIPSFIRARENAQRNACINNLRQLNGAAQQLLLEEPAATVELATVDPYIDGDATEMHCPAGADTDLYTFDDDDRPECPLMGEDATVTGHEL